MKNIQIPLLLFVVALVIGSCSKKETTPPSAAETNAILLGGPKGGSKTWNLSSVTYSVNGGVAQPVSGIPACELDNSFQFSNNATQDYKETEGATLCTSTDPTTVEQGSWAFTDDGKSLLIDGYYNPTSDQFTAEQDLPLFILVQGVLLNVDKIAADSLTISYSVTDSSTTPSTTYKFTIVFTKV